MRKLMTVVGVVLLVGVMAYPVFARGRGWGGGCSGWGKGAAVREQVKGIVGRTRERTRL